MQPPNIPSTVTIMPITMNVIHAVLGCALDRLNGLTEDPKKDQFLKLNFLGEILVECFYVAPKSDNLEKKIARLV